MFSVALSVAFTMKIGSRGSAVEVFRWLTILIPDFPWLCPSPLATIADYRRGQFSAFRFQLVAPIGCSDFPLPAFSMKTRSDHLADSKELNKSVTISEKVVKVSPARYTGFSL